MEKYAASDSFYVKVRIAQLSLLGLFCFAAVSSVVAGDRTINSKYQDSERQKELQYLLKQDCGSCHGLFLKGGLGPSLLPQALLNKPKPYLKHVISEGMPGSAMPAWKHVLSESDIDYLVLLLTSETRVALEAKQ